MDPVVDQDRADPLARRGPRHRLLRRGRPRESPLRRESRDDPPAPLELTPAIARPLRSRGGKVYIDFGQNGQGQTIVAPFSVRPLPGAPVSCPLRWEEVTATLDPSRFTITTAPARFQKLGDPLAPVLTGWIDVAATLRKLERRSAPDR